jgi:hypothetical protein
MINRRILNNVLRNVTAGKVEQPIPGAPAAPATDKPDSLAPEPQQNVEKPVQRWRYYFYDAPPENSIKFSYLSDIIGKDSPERVSLVEKLQGGNTGKYFADYFSWKKVIIATTQYSPDGNKLVVYEANLTPMGTKVAGSERIYPENSGATVEQFETDLMLYSDKRGNSGVINIDNSGESLFSDQEPHSNIVNVLLNRTRPAGRFLNFNDFTKLFDEYRIWATNLNQLLLPSFDIPTTDDVQGGHYAGGQAAFNKLAGPVLKEIEQKKQQPQQQPLGDKMKQEPAGPKSPFNPVDEQSKGGVKGDNLDIPTGSPMDNNKRFSSDTYKIKRMARKVLAGYMEEDATEDKDALSVGTTVKGIGGNPKTDEQQFKSLATQARTKAKKYDEMANVMKQFNNVGTP